MEEDVESEHDVIDENEPIARRLRTRRLPEGYYHERSDSESSTEDEEVRRVCEQELRGYQMEWPIYQECMRVIDKYRKSRRSYIEGYKVDEATYKFEEEREFEASENLEYRNEDFLWSDGPKVVVATGNTEMKGPLIGNFRREYGGEQDLFMQKRRLGSTGMMWHLLENGDSQLVFYLITKVRPSDRTSSYHLARALINLYRSSIRWVIMENDTRVVTSDI